MTTHQDTLADRLNRLIRDVPDFPKPGIVFKDITPLLSDGPALVELIDHLKARYQGRQIDRIIAIESRGFIFGTALAYALGVGVTLVRKPGKLPWKTHSEVYELEYGTDTLQIHQDAVSAAERVVIVDDLLATGGTAAATIALLERLGADIVELAFVIELTFLRGRERLGGHEVYSLIGY